MNFAKYFTQKLISNFHQIFLLYLASTFVFIHAYFSSSSVPNIFTLFALLIILLVLFINFFHKNNLFFSVYTWFFFFIFFPKKQVVFGLDSVLTNLIGVSDNLYMLPEFSFYDLINFIIIIGITTRVFSSNIKISNSENELFKIFLLPLFSGFLMILYYNFFLLNKFSSFPFDQFHHLLKMFEGSIVCLAILKSINKNNIHLVFNIFVLGLFVTVAEFFLVAFTDFIPEIVIYFSLDYRGGFRSVIHSGSLTAGMILFYGFLSLLRKTNFLSALIMSFFVLLPVYFTFQRSIMLLFVISIIFFTYQQIKLKKYLSNHITLIFLIISFFPLINMFSNNLSLIDNALNSTEDLEEIKPGGFFSYESSGGRAGAAKRGLDVFYSYPILGSGPGNLKHMMISPSISSQSNTFNMSTIEYQNYIDIITGYHPTDPHNYYIKKIAEYGIFGILFLFQFLYYLLSKSVFRSEMNIKYLIPNSGIIAILIYGLFQPFPISYPCLIFLIKWINLIE